MGHTLTDLQMSEHYMYPHPAAHDTGVIAGDGGGGGDAGDLVEPTQVNYT